MSSRDASRRRPVSSMSCSPRIPEQNAFPMGRRPEEQHPPSGLTKGIAPDARGRPPSNLKAGIRPDGNGNVVQGGKVVKTSSKKRRTIIPQNDSAPNCSLSAYPNVNPGSSSSSSTFSISSHQKALLISRIPETGTNESRRFISQSTSNLKSLNFQPSLSQPVKPLTLLNVTPIQSSCLEGGGEKSKNPLSPTANSLEKEILLPVMETVTAATPSIANTSTEGKRIIFHPTEWADRLKGSSQEDYIFGFMKHHNLRFSKESPPHLNQALDMRKVEKLPLSDRVEANSIIIQARRKTGIPFIRSGKVNSLFLSMIDPVARSSCPFSMVEMTFLLTFPLFATHETILSMFCASLQSSNPSFVPQVVEAMRHWTALIPEDFQNTEDQEDDELIYGGGKQVGKKLNFLLAMTKSELIEPISYSQRNKEYLEKFRKMEAPPAPVMPVNLRESLSLIVLDPLEVARQLTLYAHDLFQKINPRAWLSPSSSDRDIAGSTRAMSSDFNKISSFVAQSILIPDDENIRAEVLGKTAQIAENLFKMKNFHHFMAIVCAWNSAPILRLAKTWKTFRKNLKEVATLQSELSSLGDMEGNFIQLREVSAAVGNEPTIPYLGLTLSDMTFIIDGNRNAPVPLDHVNFEMLSMIGETLIRMRVAQSNPYNFESVSFIREFLTGSVVADQNQLYNVSLKREPRVSSEAPPPKKPNTSFGRRMSNFFAPGDLDARLKQLEAGTRDVRRKSFMKDSKELSSAEGAGRTGSPSQVDQPLGAAAQKLASDPGIIPTDSPTQPELEENATGGVPETNSAPFSNPPKQQPLMKGEQPPTNYFPPHMMPHATKSSYGCLQTTKMTKGLPPGKKPK